MTTIAPQSPAEPARPAMQRPEILAPAGNEEMMRAAVENGADAVYFGLQQINARLRAVNFDVADLPRLMAWLHERGVKGYVVLNTLVFCGEIEEALGVLRACSSAGVDAVLIQDLGLAALANRLVPELPVHASTQMTMTSGEAVRAVETLGLKLDRIVAARELSRRELQKMRGETERDIEVFVHGAICVAYSGQCLTSEALGGRSANRGECAQACRLPYELVVDGQLRPLDDIKYLLSPKDLAAHEDIGDLMRMGIVSLKIEGRLKSPQYVAATVQSYRAAIDSVFAHADDPQFHPKLETTLQRKLEQTFSRGFTGGYLHDIDHQAVVEGRFPKKRGSYLGRVISAERRGVTVALEGPVKPGDGVVFDAGRPDQDEEGGRVYTLLRNGKRLDTFEPLDVGTEQNILTLTFGDGAINTRNIHPGNRVWKTSDPAMESELASSYAPGKIHFQRPISARLWARANECATLELWDWEGNIVSVTDEEPAQEARNRPLTEEAAREQIARLGNTPYVLDDFDFDVIGNLMIPFSRLNAMRRDAIDTLIAKRRSIGTQRVVVNNALEEMRAEPFGDGVIKAAKNAQLAVLCRELDQVRAAVAHGEVATIYTDFEDIRLHAQARELIPADGPRFVPATLRVMKSGESGFVRRLLDTNPDAVLVRNLGAWEVLRALRPQLELIGDYSLNIANDLTARLLYRHGLHTLTPSYDLNADQLHDLLRAAPPEWFEITIHQYMPLFHMEHCVFCRFLSTGTDHTNCGRPCETHTLTLRDRVGYEHHVKADAGCRNTVFNAVAQSGSEYLSMMRESGVRKFRIDFITEGTEQVREAIDAYLPAIRGEVDGHRLWKRLRAKSKLGVTRGSLDHE